MIYHFIVYNKKNTDWRRYLGKYKIITDAHKLFVHGGPGIEIHG